MTTTFEHAQIGDRVWDFLRGYGVIKSVDNESILVVFESDMHEQMRLSMDGTAYPSGTTRRLFWDKLEYTVPQQPVRLEKGTLISQLFGKCMIRLFVATGESTSDGIQVYLPPGTDERLSNATGRLLHGHWRAATEEDIRRYKDKGTSIVPAYKDEKVFPTPSELRKQPVERKKRGPYGPRKPKTTTT